MHSPYETAGVKDTEYMIKAVKKFYETAIMADEEGIYRLIDEIIMRIALL